MNILWISHNVPYPPKTGVLQRNYNLVREASKLGNLHLIAIMQEGILPGEYNIDEAKSELGKFCHKIEIIDHLSETSKIAFIYLALKSLFTEDPLTVNSVKSLHMKNMIKQLCDESNFDIVHFDTIGLATYIDQVTGSCRILNHHNIESHLLFRRTEIEKNILKRFYFGLEAKKLKRFEAKLCPQFDINFTVSELDKERLLKIAPTSKIDTIPNGVDVDYFNSDEEKIIPGSMIMVSGMNWYPNRDAVLYMQEKIWPLISQAFQDVSWVIVGASPPQKLLDLAKSDPRVTVTGFVDDVRPYLKSAQIYLCPMRDGGGTRLKILDALSMSKPIVSTTIGYEGINITPEKNALVADTPDEFVSQISRLLKDPELRAKIGSEGRKFVINEFSWQVIGKKLSSIYHKLISN